MLIQDQFGITEDLQTSLIPQTSFLVWTFFTLITAKPTNGRFHLHLFQIISQFIFIEISTGTASLDSTKISSNSKIKLIEESEIQQVQYLHDTPHPLYADIDFN